MLAIADARALQRSVLATDLDPTAVRIARDSARRNRVGGLVAVLRATGLQAHEIARRAPFDLVMANILLSPLMRLAAPMARLLMPGAHVVLSGLLSAQAEAALAAYRSQALVLRRRIEIDGWVTLLLVARSRYG